MIKEIKSILMAEFELTEEFKQKQKMVNSAQSFEDLGYTFESAVYRLGLVHRR